MKYTEKLHAHRLRLLLNSDRKHCGCCPAQTEFGYRIMSFPWENYPCDVCRKFVGLPKVNTPQYLSPYFRCPCHIIGKEKAITISHKKLAEYYAKQT